MAFDSAPGSETLRLFLPGLACAGCMKGAEAALSATPGVHQARVNLTRKEARIAFDPAQTDEPTLTRALKRAGYEARPPEAEAETAAIRDLTLRLGVAGFAAMNVMLLSVGVWAGAEASMRDLFHWVSALIALPAMAYAGQPFFAGAWRGLKARRLAMDAPISLAIILSAASSVFETARSGEHAWFEAGVMLLFFLLIGRVLEARARAAARRAAAGLTELVGARASVITKDGRREIPCEDIEPGMRIHLPPGRRAPTDGTVTQGASDMDLAFLTGECAPVAMTPGDRVQAGTLNLTGPLVIEATTRPEDTALARMAEMTAVARRGAAWHDRIAARAARIYAPAVHVVAALAFLSWGIAGDWSDALAIATAVLIITCPCALALAVPAAHVIACARAFASGLFIKDAGALERLAQVDWIVFDKTGVLTDGRPVVAEGPEAQSPHWPLIMALAAASAHPGSRAVHEHGLSLGRCAAGITGVTEKPGHGVEAMVDGVPARLGRPGWAGAAVDASVVFSHGDARVPFRLADSLRSDAVEVIRALKDRVQGVTILSGDQPASVARIAAALGVEDFAGGLTPEGKLARLARLKASGRRVLMIGDGLNDAPAMAGAHVTMAPAGALDVTQRVADMVYAGTGLAPIPAALDLSRAAKARALESIGFSCVYNVVAAPLACFGLVTPLIAALAMSASSLVVILNAMRLRRAS